MMIPPLPCRSHSLPPLSHASDLTWWMLFWLFTVLLLLEAGMACSRPLRKKGRIWAYSVMSSWGCNFPWADPRVCSSPTALSSWRIM